MLGEGREGSEGGAEGRAEVRLGTDGGTENKHIHVFCGSDCHL